MNKYSNEFESMVSDHLCNITYDLEVDLIKRGVVSFEIWSDFFGDALFCLNGNFIVSFPTRTLSDNVAYLHYPININGLYSIRTVIDLDEYPYNIIVNSLGRLDGASSELYEKGLCFYIQKLNYNGYECLKYGYTVDIEARVKSQNRYSCFNHELIYLKYCSNPAEIEKAIKSKIKTDNPLISPEMLPDGYTETCPIFLYKFIKNIADKS